MDISNLWMYCEQIGITVGGIPNERRTFFMNRFLRLYLGVQTSDQLLGLRQFLASESP